MPLAKEALGEAGAARYEQILTTAVELFERQGYGATSLAQIADAVGVRKATLYYYLSSKVELLVAVYDKVTDELREVIRSSSSTAHPCVRLADIVRNHVDFHLEHGAFVRIVWAERYELPEEVFRAVRSREREYEDFVRSTIDQAIDAGCLVGYRPEVLASGLLGTLTTVYRWPRNTAGSEFRTEVIDLVLRFVFGRDRTCPAHGRLPGAALA